MYVRFVDCMLLCNAHMWPFSVAIGLGKYLRSCVLGNPGKDARKPESIALVTVSSAGENSEALKNFILSTNLGTSIAMFIECCCSMYRLSVSIVHSLLLLREPCMINLPSFEKMYSFFSVSNAEYPA